MMATVAALCRVHQAYLTNLSTHFQAQRNCVQDEFILIGQRFQAQAPGALGHQSMVSIVNIHVSRSAKIVCNEFCTFIWSLRYILGFQSLSVSHLLCIRPLWSYAQQMTSLKLP